MSPLHVLVTGGAGFIGSHVTDALLADGHAVRILDHLHPAAHDGPPEHLDPRAETVWGDVRDPGTMIAALDGIDAVSHQASMVGLGVDHGDVRDYVSHNDGGTATLLWALHRTGFTGRLVLASSMVVYGEGRYRCRDHGPVSPGPRMAEDLSSGRFDPPCPACGSPLTAEAITEDAPTDPRNVYAATKLHQEHLCEVVTRGSDMRLVTLRYHNVYGPRMPRDTPYAGVASIFRSALDAGRAPQVFEDGAQRRDFIHVQDVARANVLALTGEATGVFNIASGRPRTVLDLATALSRALDGPAPEVTGGWRAGDVRHVFASPARAVSELGFSAGIDFEIGIAGLARAPLRAPAPVRG